MTLLTAVELAAAVRSGTTTAVDATRDALGRIAATDGRIGAFQRVRGDKALTEAAAVDARTDLATLPLAGVPIAIKDNIPVEGEPLRDGSAGTSPDPQSGDHEVVARLRAAGAVVVGITRVPELCVFGTTDSVYGITRNPWNLRRSPGGSSGGSAAAVASGQVVIAHGNDGMGSIRIPAANCGLFGIKPGAGVVPQNIGVDAWFGMSENGPLATTVADAALMLSVMAARPLLADISEPVAPLRIAVGVGEPSPLVKTDPEFTRGLTELAGVLRAAGHEVTEVRVPYPANPLPLLARWFAGTETDAAALPNRAALEPRTRAHARWGRVLRRLGLLGDKPVDKTRAAMERLFDNYDVLLSPTLAGPAPLAIEWHRKSWFANISSNIRYAPYPSTWNLLGWPSASIPAGTHTTARVPLAVQMTAKPAPDAAGEALLLGLAAQLERLHPWQRTAPEPTREASRGGTVGEPSQNMAE
jgi:amidase